MMINGHCYVEHVQKLCCEQWVTIMNEIPYRLPLSRPSIVSVRLRPIWFIHNTFGLDAIPTISTLRRPLHEKQNEEPLQTASRPHFDGENICRHDQVPVLR